MPFEALQWTHRRGPSRRRGFRPRKNPQRAVILDMLLIWFEVVVLHAVWVLMWKVKWQACPRPWA